MSIPYKETVLGNNQYLRTFSEDVDDHELEWHKDREDRIVEVIENHGWEFQMDNELPVYLENTLFILIKSSCATYFFFSVVKDLFIYLFNKVKSVNIEENIIEIFLNQSRLINFFLFM